MEKKIGDVGKLRAAQALLPGQVARAKTHPVLPLSAWACGKEGVEIVGGVSIVQNVKHGAV
jgi:hypothetical protein